MTTPVQNRKAPSGRITHALRWRAAALRYRLREMTPPFLPVLRELRTATGRNALDLARDLIAASRQYGIDAHDFATLMLWEVPKDRWKEFVVGDELERFLQKTLDPEDRVLSRDKAAFAEIDRQRGLPWPPSLAMINRREGIAIEGAVVIDREDSLWPTLAELGRDRELAVKPSCGERGKGFFRVSPSGAICDGGGIAVDRRAFAKTVLTYTHPLGNYGYLVQPALAPHPDMVKLTGVDALASTRIVTGLKDGTPHILESFLKIPAPGRLTDNFLSGSTGTTIAGLDPETGRLTELLGLLRPGFRHVLERTSTHPVTGRRIAGAVLPLWREAVDLAHRAARAHPRTTAIGWDIAIATSGCVLIDGNPNWGPGQQPCSEHGSRRLLASLYPDNFR